MKANKRYEIKINSNKQINFIDQGISLLNSQIFTMLTSASFKLQKLNRSMQLKSSPSKTDSLFTPRMSGMNSIAKSVKYNNLQYITGQELCKLRREPEESLDNPEFSTAKNNMTNIKKRYDQTNHQKLYLENKIERLDEEKAKYMTLLKELESNKTEGKQKVSSLQNELDELKLKLMEKDFQKMSNQQMRDAIVHDKIVYDKRKYDMEKYLRNLGVKAKSIKESNIHQSEEDDRTLKVYQKLIEKLQSERKERQEHVNSIESRVFQKESINNSSLLRKSQMMSIAESTMGERDPEEKEWINIFLAQKLLKGMLQSKIEREMDKFSVVENAFKNIKIATGVNDAHTMVKKFLSKDQIYGDLLSKITQNEKEIQLLKTDKERYLRQIKKTEEELQELDTIKTQNEDLREWLKQAEYYEGKKKRGQFQQMKLKQYLHKQLKRLRNQNDSREKTSSEKVKLNTKNELKQNFIKHLTHLSTMIDEAEKLEVNENDLTSESVDQQIVEKIFRIKPLIKVNQSSGNDKNLSNEYIQPFEEEQITTANDEVQAIDEQRQYLLKSNEKFMKELKHKIQEQKQLMIETLVKNTKEKAAPVPVKKVEVVQD